MNQVASSVYVVIQPSLEVYRRLWTHLRFGFGACLAMCNSIHSDIFQVLRI
jgi:hypothetical protein